MIGGALGAGICCLLGATANIPPVGGMYGFVSITGGWAYLVGINCWCFIYCNCSSNGS